MTAPTPFTKSLSQTWILVLKAAPVRLRFVLVIASACVVIGGWETWRGYWDRWVAAAPRDRSVGAVSADTEYFCPMDPGVLSGWPGKCPVCNMTLVRRAKGDMTPLPTGVVARVQLSPSRIQLGGVRTSPVSFQAVEREVVLVGRIARADDQLIHAAIDGVDPSLLSSGRKARVLADPPDGREPVTAIVRRIEPDGADGERAVLAIHEVKPDWRPGRRVRATISVPVSEIEPFRSLPDEPPVLAVSEPRSLYVCHVHSSVRCVEPGSCPEDGDSLMAQPIASDQRIRWWCPMHPKVVADTAVSECSACGGMKLVPRVMTYRPKGRVLAVPESAVIDTGTKRVVYVENMPGIFDGVEVVTGPRCRGMIPIVSGLEPGMSVATSGAFLIDAETRLNPSLAASYFGASRSGAEADSPPASPKLDFSRLSVRDRELAIAQRTCPVTKKALGSMGTPIKVQLGERSVFACCAGCTDTLKEHPEKYLKAIAADSAHHP